MEIRTTQKQRKSRRMPVTITLSIIIMGVIMGVSIGFNNYYNNPAMIGKWISQETDKEVEFTADGMVNVEGVKTGEYVIKSPDLLIYNIENHTFEMHYKIENRNLVWGLVGEEEKFDRKGF